MLTPIVEPSRRNQILDSKLGVRADQFRNPSFVLSLDGPPVENSGRVLGGSLAWSGSFQCAFDNIRKAHARCAALIPTRRHIFI